MPTLRLGSSHGNFVFLFLLFVADNHVYPYKARINFFLFLFTFNEERDEQELNMKGLPKMVVGSLTRSNKLIALKQLLFFGLQHLFP